jgi:hypothetical protein
VRATLQHKVVGVRFLAVHRIRGHQYPRVLDELRLSACHVTEQYANNGTMTGEIGRQRLSEGESRC